MDTNTATIITIIMGVLFAVTVTIFIVYVVRKRNRKDSKRRQSHEITKTGKNY